LIIKWSIPNIFKSIYRTLFLMDEAQLMVVIALA